MLNDQHVNQLMPFEGYLQRGHIEDLDDRELSNDGARGSEYTSATS